MSETSQHLVENGEVEEENSVEEEESDSTEVVPTLVGVSESAGGPILAKSNQPSSYQTDKTLFLILQSMTQMMATLQAVSSSEY
ncbi:hypothetical protein O181_102142 [Austropuccinia psidii MF-1]|uniref:Uncharacterized protein n=1 Tax=Austropuccinia psidii MF-1 TaxID=1389203 RepID=A0A9Q3JIL9_9BASI|nr:hypothetical protein [Austropuccinia psidii MF-1]